jgi:hypothetical protein
MDKGSSPTPGALPSVRVPTYIEYTDSQEANFLCNSSKIRQESSNKIDNLIENQQMRDLYNRKKKLDYWTERIHKDLDEHDKKDVLKFLEIMGSVESIIAN